MTTRKTVRARCAALLRPEGANPMGWRLLRHVDDAREGLVVHELPAGIANRLSASASARYPRASAPMPPSNGAKQCHVRAVDADGLVLGDLVQGREGRRAAEKLGRKFNRKQSRTPRVMVTDKLGSDGAARAGMRSPGR